MRATDKQFHVGKVRTTVLWVSHGSTPTCCSVCDLSQAVSMSGRCPEPHLPPTAGAVRSDSGSFHAIARHRRALEAPMLPKVFQPR